MLKQILFFSCLFLLFSCKKENPDDNNQGVPTENNIYFPPIDSDDWESISPAELGWNEAEIENLTNFLEEANSRAFIVLKDGKIVIEEYWGDNLADTAPFGASSNWYWASAGKTLTATLVGIAQQEGKLDIEDKTSQYLGTGWTSMSNEKEDLIKIRHQLTMTTGLDFENLDLDCVESECLTYKTDAGDQWFYHNAPYTLLGNVISNAVGMDYNDYTKQKLNSEIGMNGSWTPIGPLNVYFSTARSMARFGLLISNKGIWGDVGILMDENYFENMVNTSQELNQSYGYLWWLNGKDYIVFPGLPVSFNIPLSQNAPSDLFAGIGKDGQIVDIVPSQNLVVIRMGKAPDNSLVPVNFHDEMWEKLNLVIN